MAVLSTVLLHMYVHVYLHYLSHLSPEFMTIIFNRFALSYQNCFFQHLAVTLYRVAKPGANTSAVDTTMHALNISPRRG